MLYENYRGRILKVKEVLQTLWRFRILIFSLLAFVFASLGAFFGVYGLVYEVTPNIETISYGQDPGYSAGAVFSSVRYEYAPQDSDEWTETQPVRAGEYKVRAVSRNIFGGNRYGKEYAFVIAPKQVDVVVDVESFLYGETPQVSAPLEYGDTLVCTQFSYEDLTSPYTKVIAEQESIHIYDTAGEEVTDCYSLRPVARLISFVKREIGIVVQDKSGIYDGTPLQFDSYELDENTPLAEGDSIVAVFEDSITEAGETQNLPSIKILHQENGETFDVTIHYSIEITAGTLTVEKRPLRITTPDREKVYDGTPLSLAEGYALAEDCSLVEGHTLHVTEASSVTQVGSAENILLFQILDKDGQDVTKNYSVFLETGTLTVTPRPVAFVTATNEWVYDGKAHSDEGYALSDSSAYPLADGQTSALSSQTEITDAGSVENKLSIVISDENGEDVTQNYDITFEYGTLTVTPRSVTFVTASNEWVYDGKAHSDGEYALSESSAYPLADGQTSALSSQTEITDAGSVENKLSLVISDENGGDVTKNYDISYEYGTLTVTPRAVTFITASNEWVYDGTAHSDGEHQVSDSSAYPLAEGQTSASSSLTEITDVGSAQNVMTVTVSDENGKDVTENYDISFEYGTLTVTPRPVTFVTATNEWVYDGTAHSDGGHQVSDSSAYPLVEGQTSASSSLTEITDVGSVQNVMTVTVSDSEGRDVTSNYAISFEYGTLTVTPRSVTFVTASNEWVYDGTAHSDGKHWVSDTSAYPLADGQTSASSSLTEITDVGSVQNVMIITVSDSEGRDVTKNYEITYEYGTLTVTPRPVTFQTATNTWVYDGVAHSDGKHWVSDTSAYPLADGQTSASSSLTEITDVGSVQNVMIITVSDSEGRDVTKNYEITYEYGTLTVTPRPVTFQTATNTWVYDGVAHSDGRHWVSEASAYPLADGHTSDSSSLTEITDVGSVQNVMTVTVWDGAGREVTGNYQITVEYGILTVTLRPVTFVTATNEWVYDGVAHSDGKHWVSETSAYPLADGQTSASSALTEITDVGSAKNVMTVTVSDSAGRDVTSNYEITYEYGTLTVTPRPVTITAGSDTKEYDGTPLTCNEVIVTTDLDWALVAGHELKAELSGSQTDAGESENEVISVHILDGERDVTFNYEITTVKGTLSVYARSITVIAGSAKKVYDGQELVCQTYKLFKEEGEPLVLDHQERVVVAGSQTEVGESANKIVSVQIFAGERDVTFNYAITCEDGVLLVTPRSVTFVTATNEWVYDGVVHSDGSHRVSETSEYKLVEGHTSDSSSLTEITDAGSAKNEMIITVSDAEGRDITSNYEITYEYGTLTVTPRPVTVTAGSDTKVYDGTPLTCSEFTVTSGLEWALVSGHEAKVEIVGSQTDVGESENKVVSVQIFDGEGRDVTKNYDIALKSGTLTVTPRPITVTAGSATKPYDGTPLTCSEFTVTSDLEWALVAGHEVKAEIVGSQTEIGKSVNELLSVRILDGERDVTGNYAVTLKDGTLEVIPRPVLFTTASASWLYDGKDHFDADHWVSENSLCGLLEGHRSVSSLWTQIREIGSVENKMVITVVDAEGKDVTEYYQVLYDYGTLRVVFAKIFVQTESAEKVYDGTELVCDRYSIETEFAAGYESAETEVICTGEITNAGETQNTFTIRVFFGGEERTEDVEVTFELGLLHVIPRPITITTGSGEWEYDKKPHSLPGVTVSAGEYEGTFYEMLDGHTYNADGYPSITEPGQVQNSCRFLIYDASSNDVTDNYRIITDFGTLTILGDGGEGGDGGDGGDGGSGGGGGSGGNGDLDTSGNIGGGGGGGGGEAAVAIRVLSDADGQIYLRLMSFGDLNNAETKWESAVPYEELLDGKYSYNYLTGIALENAGYPRLDVSVDVVGNCYYLPYYMATGEGDYLIQESDVLYTGSTEEIYSLEYFLYDITAESVPTGMLGQYADAEARYRAWVERHYKQTDLSYQLKEYFDKIIAQNGWREEEDVAILISEVASFIQNAATYNLKYNSKLDSSQDIVYDFLQVYKEGICQHYATAATVLLRYLGIPARYSMGYVGSTSAGEWTEITTKNAHAWVEVYIGGFGWVQVEVTGGGPGGGGGGGGGGSSEPKLYLKPVDAWKQFDGTELVATKVEGADDASKLLLYDYLERGYTYQATFSGSQTQVGSSKSEILSFTLYDPSGQEVKEFRRIFRPGKLTVVTENIITICPYSLQKVYDGTPLSYGANDYYVTGLPENWRAEYSLEGVEITDAGVFDYENFSKASLKVYGADGSLLTEGEDYVAVFDTDAALIVTKRKITLTSASASKKYDGTPLVKDSVWISEGSLAAGQTLTANTVSSIVDIGETENEIGAVLIFDADGANTGRNYDVTLKNGKLVVF